jgi:hypothetical protein
MAVISIRRDAMLWMIMFTLVVLWWMGVLAHFGGDLIHLLLLAAAVLGLVKFSSLAASLPEDHAEETAQVSEDW